VFYSRSIKKLAANTKNGGQQQADDLIRKGEKDGGNNHEDENHRGRDHDFFAGWPCDLTRLRAHLLEELEGIEFRHHNCLFGSNFATVSGNEKLVP
jgi:hypothetical protein